MLPLKTAFRVQKIYMDVIMNTSNLPVLVQDAVIQVGWRCHHKVIEFIHPGERYHRVTYTPAKSVTPDSESCPPFLMWQSAWNATPHANLGFSV